MQVHQSGSLLPSMPQGRWKVCGALRPVIPETRREVKRLELPIFEVRRSAHSFHAGSLGSCACSIDCLACCADHSRPEVKHLAFSSAFSITRRPFCELAVDLRLWEAQMTGCERPSAVRRMFAADLPNLCHHRLFLPITTFSKSVSRQLLQPSAHLCYSQAKSAMSNRIHHQALSATCNR